MSKILYQHKGPRFGLHVDVGGKQLNIAVYDVKHVALLFAVGLPLEWPNAFTYPPEDETMAGLSRFACGPFAFSVVHPKTTAAIA